MNAPIIALVTLLCCLANRDSAFSTHMQHYTQLHGTLIHHSTSTFNTHLSIILVTCENQSNTCCGSSASTKSWSRDTTCTTWQGGVTPSTIMAKGRNSSDCHGKRAYVHTCGDTPLCHENGGDTPLIPNFQDRKGTPTRQIAPPSEY